MVGVTPRCSENLRGERQASACEEDAEQPRLGAQVHNNCLMESLFPSPSPHCKQPDGKAAFRHAETSLKHELNVYAGGTCADAAPECVTITMLTVIPAVTTACCWVLELGRCVAYALGV